MFSEYRKSMGGRLHIAEESASKVTEILRLRQTSAGSWAEARYAELRTEATSWAVMALAGERDENARNAAELGCRWLMSRQFGEGSIPAFAHPRAPGWTTPLALLAWFASGFEGSFVDRAIEWLCRVEVSSPPRSPVFDHDPSIRGWPWVGSTACWVEPTALAIWALAVWRHADLGRVHEGRRLLLDRALATGGWNYGNPQVFGREQGFQPDMTSLALLALEATGGFPELLRESALARLGVALESGASGRSLGLGLLALEACGRNSARFHERLERAIEVAGQREACDRPIGTVALAQLLLACRARTSDLVLRCVTSKPEM
jgi:hypothetical protein